MRSLEELIDASDPGWAVVSEWFGKARNSVQVLPATRASAEEVLLALQVTSRSPLGALALETGGVFFDNRWLRFLGSGHPAMQATLHSWNSWLTDSANESNTLKPPLPGALVVASDAVGGFFAVNGGAFDGTQGSVYYFAPDALEWEALDFSYSQLLNWACNGDLAGFYSNARWPGWEREVAALNGNTGVSIFPPLWANQGTPVSARSRRAAPITELWGIGQEVMEQLRRKSGG